MKTEEFGNFLRNVKRQGKQTIDSRLSNCRTIEEHEGDLDQHFDQGRVDQPSIGLPTQPRTNALASPSGIGFR